MQYAKATLLNHAPLQSMPTSGPNFFAVLAARTQYSAYMAASSLQLIPVCGFNLQLIPACTLTACVPGSLRLGIIRKAIYWIHRLQGRHQQPGVRSSMDWSCLKKELYTELVMVKAPRSGGITGFFVLVG
jgi:hypothetical protein